MESTVKDHILSHESINNLLSSYQFGFIPGRSCSTQLLQMLNYLMYYLDNEYSIDTIFWMIVPSLGLMFADNTKIFHVMRNEEDYAALQNDLDLLVADHACNCCNM